MDYFSFISHTHFIADRMYAWHIHKEQQQLHMVSSAVKSLSRCTSQCFNQGRLIWKDFANHSDFHFGGDGLKRALEQL